ncbi:MAG: sigma 54-interacting transcriptional regulator [Anaerovoracaceae bacterium]
MSQIDVISNKFLELVLNQAGIFALLDREGKYIFVNDKWVEDTGIPSEAAIGKYCYEVISGSRGMVAINTGKMIPGDMHLTTFEGKKLPGVITYTPIFDGEEITGVCITSTFFSQSDAKKFIARVENIDDEMHYIKNEIKRSYGAKYSIEDIIGNSKAILKLKQDIYNASMTNSTVMIEGETGTGKELVAHAIHELSLRHIFPFVKVNCAAIPDSLMESEFFGYEDGSFTGGIKGGKAGKFEKAHLGSMFLDEINQLDIKMQPKILRVLQEKEIERIGGFESYPIDVRIISATNRNINEIIEEGSFRSDLFYRLNVLHIRIPPLRERKEDIPLLVDFFIDDLNDEMGMGIEGISKDALEILLSYNWPGNVRELKNIIERAMNSARRNIIEVVDLDFGKPANNDNSFKGNYGQGNMIKSNRNVQTLTNPKHIDERETLLNLLNKHSHNKTKVAKEMNISRTMLYKKMHKYGLI